MLEQVKITGRRGDWMADVHWSSGKQKLPCLHQKYFILDETGPHYFDAWTSDNPQFVKHIEAMRTTKRAVITLDEYHGDKPGGEGRFKRLDYVGVWEASKSR